MKSHLGKKVKKSLVKNEKFTARNEKSSVKKPSLNQK